MKKRSLAPAAFIGPAFIHLLVFALIPMGYALYLSLHNVHLIHGTSRFVGAANYSYTLTDPPFWNALWNSARYALMSVPIGMAVGLGVALIVNQKLKGVTIFRTLFYIPSIASGIALAMIWIYVFLPETGMINAVLGWLGITNKTDFLNNITWAMWALVIMSALTGVGPKMVLFLAGLINIPQELYEAASLDGATRTRTFWRITIPMLAPTTFFIMVTSTIAAMQVFTPVYLMTKGGPEDSTDVIGYHIYREAWVQFNTGLAAAQSFILLLFIATIAVGQFLMQKASTRGVLADMNSRDYQARLRDAILYLIGAFLIGWIPCKLGWAAINGWLVGIPIAIAAIVAINGIAILTELPILGKFVRVVLSYATMLLLAGILVGPMVWMLLISLHPPKSVIPHLNETLPIIKTENVVNGKTETSVKTDMHWENYDTVINSPTLPVRRFFLNTVFVTCTVVFFQLLICSLCAYGLSRLRFRGRELIFAVFLGSMMFVGPAIQIPVYLMLKSFGWLDTYWALIVPGISSAFSVFLLRQFFLQIPIELDEAAKLDGANDWTIYLRVILPLSKAALATAGAFTFFAVWTDFFGPLIYTNSTNMRTLELGLSVFKGSYANNNWPLQMTAALVVMAPLVFVFLFVQRYFTRGIMLGSIK